jgi:hypothetical protein
MMRLLIRSRTRLPVFLLLLLLCGCSQSAQDFRRLKAASKDDPEMATRLAESIKDDPEAVSAALNDFDVFGGSNRGLSSWILTCSKAEEVEPRLRHVATSTVEPIERRLEALSILWLRTGQTNLTLLDDMFLLVKPAGQPVVGHGRHILVTYLADEAADVRDALRAPASQPIRVSPDEFSRAIRRAGATYRWPQPEKPGFRANR